MKKVLLVSLILFVVSSAVADNIFPPNWSNPDRRLHAEWDTWYGFESSTTTPPDVSNYDDLLSDPTFNPYVPLEALLSGTGSLVETTHDRTKLIGTTYDDELKFMIPNFSGGEEKTIRIQVTWLEDKTCPYTVMFDLTAYNEAYQVIEGYDDLYTGGSDRMVHEAPVPGHDTLVWATIAADFHIEPNPYYEEIGIKFRFNGEEAGGLIDQVVIDTICGEVPEPMTVCLLGLGGLFLRRKRRA